MQLLLLLLLFLLWKQIWLLIWICSICGIQDLLLQSLCLLIDVGQIGVCSVRWTYGIRCWCCYRLGGGCIRCIMLCKVSHPLLLFILRHIGARLSNVVLIVHVGIGV